MRLALPLSAVLAACLAAPAAGQPLAPLNGDAEATARIGRMLERMGGRAYWARVRGIYIRYRQYRSGPWVGQGEERAWRDLGEPYERLEWRFDLDGGGQRVSAHGFDPQSGWRRRNGVIQAMTAEAHRGVVAFWTHDFYTMFRRMAAGTPEVRYRFSAPNHIEMTGADGEALGWWDIDAAGNMMRWGATDETGEALSYVYGPFKTYGRIAFPAWGASSDGQFRFEYAEFVTGAEPFARDLLADPATPPPDGRRLGGKGTRP